MNVVVERTFLQDESATLAFAAGFAKTLEGGELVFLVGDLGAGKTTFVRGVLRAMGFAGTVRSPTYTLVEAYEIGDKPVYHFDFYRLEDVLELEFIGIDELLCAPGAKFVEWPDRFRRRLPQPDVEIVFADRAGGREVAVTRERPADG